jgi:hypothetical protein
MRSLLQQLNSRSIDERARAARDRAVSRHGYPYRLRQI